jgi:curved DNA-binding protein CbpA
MPQRKNAHEYYAVLGLQPGASSAELRRKWIKLVKEWHPDRFARNSRLQSFAQEKLKKINEAYTFLRDYDPARGVSRYESSKPADSYAGAYRTNAGRTYGYDQHYHTTRPRPGPSPYDGDYQYRPVSKKSPSVFSWIIMYIFLSNLTGIFSGTYGPDPGSPPAQSHDRTEAKAAGISVPRSPASTPQQFPYFVHGSSKADVYRIQGVPTYSTETEWRYGHSRVYFVGDHVVRWESRPDSPLRARAPDDSSGYFGIGSSMVQVLTVQGKPSYIDENEWKYGESSVQFQDGKVRDWHETPGSPLRVQWRPNGSDDEL